MSSLLEIRGLVVSFGRSFSVGPMNLVTDHGAIHLVGPNGGGKTSLLRAIGGELRPSEGSVRVSGHDVQTSVEGRRQLAFVPSGPELPEFLTVREAYQFADRQNGTAHRTVRPWTWNRAYYSDTQVPVSAEKPNLSVP
jgi:ABC-type multidrug transport system ATPase subunit